MCVGGAEREGERGIESEREMEREREGQREGGRWRERKTRLVSRAHIPP